LFAASARDCHRGGITWHLAFPLSDDQVSFDEMIILVATRETAGINPNFFGPLRKTLEDLLNIESNQRGLHKRTGAVIVGESHAAEENRIRPDVCTRRARGTTVTWPERPGPACNQKRERQRSIHRH
jgi:hypothetical protein